MTKQGEIREVIDEYTDDVCLYKSRDCGHHSQPRFEYCLSTEGAYKCLMQRLGELGVAIIDKERELPDTPDYSMCKTIEESTAYQAGYIQRGADFIQAGYVAVVPLIKRVEQEEAQKHE